MYRNGPQAESVLPLSSGQATYLGYTPVGGGGQRRRAGIGRAWRMLCRRCMSCVTGPQLLGAVQHMDTWPGTIGSSSSSMAHAVHVGCITIS